MAGTDADVIDALTGITPGSPLDAIRARRKEARAQAQATYRALFTPDEVIASLQTDTALARATDVAVQVHSIDPPHPFTLRSIELVAEVVAPALGWGRDAAGSGVVTIQPRGR